MAAAGALTAAAGAIGMAAATQQDKDPASGGNFFHIIPGKDAAELEAKITTISGELPGWASQPHANSP